MGLRTSRPFLEPFVAANAEGALGTIACKYSSSRVATCVPPSGVDLVGVPLAVPKTLLAGGISVPISPPLLLSTNLVGIEALPLSSPLEDRLAVVRVPAAVILEVAVTVLLTPLTNHDAITVCPVAVCMARPQAAA